MPASHEPVSTRFFQAIPDWVARQDLTQDPWSWDKTEPAVTRGKPMTMIVLEFLFFACIIIVAGTFLSRYADEIAEITGLGRLLVGSILLAGATSLPELSVDIACIRQGNPDLAVGDLLGSCLMNLLILAVIDLTHHTRGKMFSRAAAGHALGASASISLIAVVALSLFVDGKLGAREWMGLGAGSALAIIGYLLGVRIIYLDQRVAVRVAARAAERAEADESAPVGKRVISWPLAKPVACFATAALVILLVGPRMSAAADEIAVQSGLAKSFVGTTLIALSTSLPELVTCWAAVRLGRHDLAIGNIFGSNAFNMLILAGLDFVQPGSLLALVSTVHCVTAISAILATSVTVMGQLYHVERRRWLVEPDALIVIAISIICLVIVYALPA